MLELQRNVIFGQFVETGSFIHRMDARVKIAATFVLIVASFLIDDFLGFAVVLPLLIVVGVVSKIPLGYVLRGSQIFLAFLAFILAFQISSTPEMCRNRAICGGGGNSRSQPRACTRRA